MAQQTAVEWLIEQLNKNENIRWRGAPVSELTEQAKAMEKEQTIRFAISCHQDILRDRNAPNNLISENLFLFEQYYNETYKK